MMKTAVKEMHRTLRLAGEATWKGGWPVGVLATPKSRAKAKRTHEEWTKRVNDGERREWMNPGLPAQLRLFTVYEDPETVSNGLCSHYIIGSCRKGAACRYSHANDPNLLNDPRNLRVEYVDVINTVEGGMWDAREESVGNNMYAFKAGVAIFTADTLKTGLPGT